MTSYNFGDVVLVPFPFTDQTTNKKRPAFVISSDVYNAEYPDRILMGITSQVSSSPKVGDIVITDWGSAGLLKASMIKAVITTIEKKQILKKLGRLQDVDIQPLKEGLIGIIGNSGGSSLLDMGEKGISLFFNRRWTQINADVRRARSLLIIKQVLTLLHLAEKGLSLF